MHQEHEEWWVVGERLPPNGSEQTRKRHRDPGKGPRVTPSRSAVLRWLMRDSVVRRVPVATSEYSLRGEPTMLSGLDLVLIGIGALAVALVVSRAVEAAKKRGQASDGPDGPRP